MKKKTLYKRILGVLILVCAFSTISVHAGSATCEEVLETTDWASRYGIEFELTDSEDSYVLTMNKNEMASGITNKNKIKFKISKITALKADDTNPTIPLAVMDSDIQNYIISGNSTLTVANPKTVIKKYTGSDVVGMQIDLVADFDIKNNDEQLKESCGENEIVTVYADVYVEDGTDYIVDNIEYSLPSTTLTFGSKINCDDYVTNDGSFNYRFCEAKRKATANGNAYTFTNTKNTFAKLTSNSTASFKCDAFNIVSFDGGVPKDSNGNVLSNYYVNKNYLYGSGEFTVTAGEYIYHYGCSNLKDKPSKTVPATCKVKCEESVEVEYGPPVAGKAGMCFEYNVKVTSRVVCNADGEITTPETSRVCYPKPICRHTNNNGSTRIYNQGGPNEDFDACIESCDGGVYSDKCTNKCYKQVYGSSLSKTSGIEITYADKLDSYTSSSVNVKKVATTQDGYNGYYTCRGNEVIWSNGTTYRNGQSSDPNDSPWHKNNSWGIRPMSGYTTYTDNGIPKRQTCRDKCSWSTSNCPADSSYWSKEQANEDKTYNETVYENLKNKCDAYAKCSTTQAEFTINVNYTDKDDNKKTTIYFPYTSSNDSNTKDTIKYQDSSKTVVSTKGQNNTTIISSNGCYGENNTNNWYQAEWGFPGSWIHAKNGNIVYEPQTGISWTKYPKKFCIPSNIAEVNKKWWTYYYKTLYSSDSRFSYNDSDYLTNIKDCSSDSTKESITCNYQNTTFTKADEANIDWNINAATRKFGLYEWDIDISCFYAFSRVTTGNNTDKSCESCASGDESYRIRPVDLNNLFPDSEGTSLTDSSATGRSPGFNWSMYANNTIKDENYISVPSEYTKWIQKNAYSVYSNDNLDYQVTLTKSIINKLKSANRNYTAFEGNVELNSVVNYQSPLFRGQNAILKNAKYPNGDAIKCNNMVNYSSNQCQSFLGEG